MRIVNTLKLGPSTSNAMSLQEFLLSRFKSWKPTAPEVISRTKRDITMRWEQEEFAFLQDELLYRVETNHKLPKWIVVYR